ncbi:MAG: hypothetical protein AVDCRST_MAG93-4192 [uncultured Chloroflexia bacterium]|uniref:Uncharacterized protein n=1 Tax=uncultured Chloroflexia bacterium TaxID=1672391 RepID=A0A6J4K3N3_9CHLR|nr:MAG: hypothetical protein AVDCRST_MAG93-4192 [uncultured Chloroflexia bacterium]
MEERLESSMNQEYQTLIAWRKAHILLNRWQTVLVATQESV